MFPLLRMGYRWFDPMFLLYISPAILLSVIAQIWVKASFAKWKKRKNTRGITGAEAARRILDDAGLQDVEVRRVSGQLSDHYSPTNRTVNLSADVHDSPSIGAVGIAAHEVGHAIQHARSYFPLVLRHAMVPAVSLGGKVYFILFIIAMLMNSQGMFLAGIIVFGLVVLFSFVTLPVEFNASTRAMRLVTDSDILFPEEKAGVRNVLTAAALTYVAAALQALLTLLYYVMRFSGSRK